MTNFYHKVIKKPEKQVLQAAELSGLNRNTINRIYLALRERIYTKSEQQRSMFDIVEVSESLFGVKRVKGKN